MRTFLRFISQANELSSGRFNFECLKLDVALVVVADTFYYAISFFVCVSVIYLVERARLAHIEWMVVLVVVVLVVLSGTIYIWSFFPLLFLLLLIANGHRKGEHNTETKAEQQPPPQQ